jgi:hypothetical protein
VPLYLADVRNILHTFVQDEHTRPKRRLRVRWRWFAKKQHRFDCPLRVLITEYPLSWAMVGTYALADLEVNLRARSWSALLLSSRNHTGVEHACCFSTWLMSTGTHDLAHLGYRGS